MAHSLALTTIAFSPWTSTAIEKFATNAPKNELSIYWDNIKVALQAIRMHRLVACGSISASSMSVLAPDIYVLTAINVGAVCAFIYSIRSLYDRADKVHEGISGYLKVRCLGADSLVNSKGNPASVQYGSGGIAVHVIDTTEDLDELEALTKTGGAKGGAVV